MTLLRTYDHRLTRRQQEKLYWEMKTTETTGGPKVRICFQVVYYQLDGFGNFVKHSSIPLTPNSPKGQDEQGVESFLVIALQLATC